ncbi:hypothetical protein KKD52_18735 [Myxococcota bacterium]|nr:hypothetical protein [Myxococcota bacterium]
MLEILQDKVMVSIVYASSLDYFVMGALQSKGIHYYTKWEEVFGEGQHSIPHLDSHVWPGINFMLALFVDLPQQETIFRIVEDLKDQFPQDGIKAFAFPLLKST